jgi:hypothetical protein
VAGPKIDEIGPWSEVKLDIIKRYAVEYSKILSNQKNPAFFHVYIDALAGTGFHVSETTGEMVLGSVDRFFISSAHCIVESRMPLPRRHL